VLEAESDKKEGPEEERYRKTLTRKMRLTEKK
jgi:hypothetical protein